MNSITCRQLQLFMKGFDVRYQFMQATNAHWTWRRTWFPSFICFLDIGLLHSIIEKKRLGITPHHVRRRSMAMRNTIIHSYILGWKEKKELESIKRSDTGNNEELSPRLNLNIERNNRNNGNVCYQNPSTYARVKYLTASITSLDFGKSKIYINQRNNWS